ncbi:MAG: glycine--tRNA ligase subunit beta [Sulfuricaulis sp.]
MTSSLLIELFTEELPPKALARLMAAFSRDIYAGLNAKNFLAAGAEPRAYATPRRLAVLISNVLDKQPDRVVERKGPAVTAALDAAGRPTPALLGFAKSCRVVLAKLDKRSGDKGEYFVFSSKQKGERLKQHLAAIVETALKQLPVPKIMRWGSGTVQFVRPVHSVILLHGHQVVPGVVLGIKSGNKTLGHRFLSHGTIAIQHAKNYEKILKQQGKVIAAFETRRDDLIIRQLDAATLRLGKETTWKVGRQRSDKVDELTELSMLLDEVTSLVEYPQVYVGSFDAAFLEVPRECLIISMRQHQKYFPVADKQGKLLPNFLFVSNMKVPNPREIIHGNERVLRARLSDARFFYDQDRKHKLADRLPRLANVVYHNKLGSQLERVQRLEKLSGKIAQLIKADVAYTERAARLCKTDLLTEMVGEFPELQGIMGRYYAHHDHEPSEVADAIEQHYYPRTAAGELPQNPIAICVALADKLDTLVGIYGIGLIPTGEKDPFGLRRAALGTVRILVEKSLPLDVLELLVRAHSQFPIGIIAAGVAQDLHAFMLERLKPYLKDRGFEPDEIDAIVSLKPTRLDQVLPRMKAIREFRALPEAQALGAANKRIRNILRQAGGAPSGGVDVARLSEPAEHQLFEAVQRLEGLVAPLIKSGSYTDALKRLADLRPVVDNFFDQVMVMADDTDVRNNRLALLSRLSDLFMDVADISRLQG